jgi:hypothetical protein
MTLAIIISCLAVLVSVKSAVGADNGDPTIPPTAPLVLTAIYENGQVNLGWEASQPGHFALHLYHVFRESGSHDFVEIAQVDAASVSYVDREGNHGDYYKVTATDDQNPVNTSPDSDLVIATDPTAIVDRHPATYSELPKPQSASIRAVDLPPGVSSSEASLPSDSQPANLWRLTIPDKLDSATIAKINHGGDVHVAQLDEAVRSGRKNFVLPILTQYRYEKQQLYRQFTTMRQTDRIQVKRACAQQSQALETSILNLPESYQMTSLVALASCHLIETQP